MPNAPSRQTAAALNNPALPIVIYMAVVGDGTLALRVLWPSGTSSVLATEV